MSNEKRGKKKTPPPKKTKKTKKQQKKNHKKHHKNPTKKPPALFFFFFFFFFFFLGARGGGGEKIAWQSKSRPAIFYLRFVRFGDSLSVRRRRFEHAEPLLSRVFLYIITSYSLSSQKSFHPETCRSRVAYSNIIIIST